MWVLFLNHMRDAKIEMLQPVARAETKEELKAFIDRERCEPYQDEPSPPYNIAWVHNFKQGGPLEWHNPPYEHMEDEHFVYVGSLEEWLEGATINYNERVMSIPEA